MKNSLFNKKKNTSKYNIVKLLDNNSKYLGIYKFKDCFKYFKNSNFDLVEIGTKFGFSICKLVINYNKFKYLQLKKKKKQNNKLKKKKPKEVKFKLFTATNDKKNKINLVKKFLFKNFNVKVFLKIKGRESLKTNIIKESINDIIKSVDNGFLINKPNLNKYPIILFFSLKNV